MPTEHLLWRLQGFIDIMECVAVEEPEGCALGLRQGADLIVAELHPSAQAALVRAQALRERLLDRGWQDLQDASVAVASA